MRRPVVLLGVLLAFAAGLAIAVGGDDEPAPPRPPDRVDQADGHTKRDIAASGVDTHDEAVALLADVGSTARRVMRRSRGLAPEDLEIRLQDARDAERFDVLFDLVDGYDDMRASRSIYVLAPGSSAETMVLAYRVPSGDRLVVARVHSDGRTEFETRSP
jgi:hypothetical protein